MRDARHRALARRWIHRPATCGRIALALSAAVLAAGTLATGLALADSGAVIALYAGDPGAGAQSGALGSGTATSVPLDFPYGNVAVDASGDVLFADETANEVAEVTPAGQLSVLVAGLSSPDGVAVDSAGDVFIADYGHQVVWEIPPGGSPAIVAGEEGQFGSVTPGPATATPIGSPTGVAVDDAGDIYIASSLDEILEVTPGGTLSVIADANGMATQAGPQPALDANLTGPTGLAVDAIGDVYIADTGYNEIQELTPPGAGPQWGLRVAAGNGMNGQPQKGSLSGPVGVAVDAAGDLFIADTGNSDVEEVFAGGSGALSIVAGSNSPGAPSYGAPPGTSEVDMPTGVAVEPDGTLFVTDSSNATIDRIGDTTPGPPGAPALSGGDGTVTATFAAPIDPGLSPVIGYDISLDNGVTWPAGLSVALASAPGATVTLTLNGLSDGTTYTVRIRARNGNGPGPEGAAGQVTPVATGVGLGAPGGSGTTTTTTTTTSSTGTGSTTAPPSSGAAKTCPKPSGALTGIRLGPLSLGEARATARRRLPRHSSTGDSRDMFCLLGGAGISVRYATAGALRGLTRAERVHLQGRIDLALTANPYYAIDGVTAGDRLILPAKAKRAELQLKIGGGVKVGSSTWYEVPDHGATGVIEVRRGVVLAVGIAESDLTVTPAARKALYKGA